MNRPLLLLLLLLGAACSTTEPASPPAAPIGITITPLQESRYLGGRAVYTVDAPLDLVRRELLDYEAQAAYRPIVVEARTVSRGEQGGEVFFRFRKKWGFTPEALCNWTETEWGDGVRIAWEMTNSSFALQGMRGAFGLEPVSDGRTVIRQTFLLSALMMDEEELLADLRADAAAIRDHLESAASEERE